MPRGGGRIWQAHGMCVQSILLLLFWLSCYRPRGLGELARNTLIWPVLLLSLTEDVGKNGGTLEKTVRGG